MFLSFRFVVFSSFLFLHFHPSKCVAEVLCQYSDTARDQGLISHRSTRSRRFVLFPEFELWKNDWRYLHHPKEFIYWISNYYPQKIDSRRVGTYLQHIIQSINEVIGQKIVSVREASTVNTANAYYKFFKYKVCPTDDPSATTTDIQSVGPLLIYPEDIIRKNRYRAHGGIAVNPENNITTSHIKFNTHHMFVLHEDFQYDPVDYICNSDESHCVIDLYAVLLHETLHGFSIEHTERDLPNPKMRAVMHLYSSRIMCHDDIRAIRKVYGLAVTRQHAKYDDTCRRDFPLGRSQKLMHKIHRWIDFYVLRLGSSVSFGAFSLTMMVIVLRKRYCGRNDQHLSGSMQSEDSPQPYYKQHKTAMNAFLWHEDYLHS